QQPSSPPSSSPPYEVVALLDRLYNKQSDNEEKHAIQQQLQQYQGTTFNWRYCLAHLNEFNDPYVWFFAINTVERTVNLQWHQLNPAERQHLRQSLLQLFSEYPPNVPAMHRDKMAHLLARVERRECCIADSTAYGAFVETVTQLLERKFPLGLALAGAIGDSVIETMNREGPSSFLQIVHRYAPSIMSALNRYCRLFVTLAMGMSSGTEFDLVSAERKNQYCCQLLAVVQQYFSWMRLDQLDAALMSNLAVLACSWDVMRDGALGGVGAYTELLYRNERLAPAAGVQLAIGVYGVLDAVVKKPTDELYQDKVCDLLRQYMKRGWPYNSGLQACTDALLQNLFEFTISSKSPQALMDRVNLWTYVCGGPRYADDEDAVWPMQQQQEEQQPFRPQLSADYAHQLMSFLNMTLFFQSYPSLDQLDDDEQDENSETELQRYYNQHIDLIVLLVQRLEPEQLDNALRTLLMAINLPTPFGEGRRLFHAMVDTFKGWCQMLDGFGEQEIRTCMMDYATASKLAVALATALHGKFQSVDYIIYQVTASHIQLLIELSGVMSAFVQFANRMVAISQQLFQALVQFIIETKNWIQLGPETNVHIEGYGVHTRKISPAASTEQLFSIISLLPKYLKHYPDANEDNWMPVVCAAIELITFFIANVALCGPQTCTFVFNQLYQGECVSSKLAYLKRSTRIQVYRMVCFCLLRLESEVKDAATNNSPAAGGPTPDSPRLVQYLGVIGSGILDFHPDCWSKASTTEQQQITQTLTAELNDLTDLLIYFDTQMSSVMRTHLGNAMYRMVEKVIYIFRCTQFVSGLAANDASGCQQLIDALLDFCAQTVGTLQSKLDMVLLKQVVELLHELFVEEGKLGLRRLRCAHTLLKTLRKLVPDQRNRALVPVLMQVVLDELLPVVTRDDRFRADREGLLQYEDVLGEQFALLHDLLHHRWQHFVDTSPLMRLDPQERGMVQPEAFLAVMHAYGYVLTACVGYPQVVGTVLASLEMLEERRSLYKLPVFANQLMPLFVPSLLKLAVSDIGAMHMEQLAKSLYGMSRIDPMLILTTICNMGLVRDSAIYHMLETVDDFTTFHTLLQQIAKEAKTRLPEEVPVNVASFIA
uniref:Importin N-terminal domain-containing protein n=1 Tax=Anopheles epiroticus TaxID=199890 RepID=A0A182PT57_9DIPT